MSQPPTKSELPPPQAPQAISKWARVYAQNRSLGVVVSLVIFVLLAAAIGGPSYFAGEAYRSGNMLVFWASIALLVPALVALTYLSIPQWGGKLQERVIQHLYAKEGKVAFSQPSERKKAWGLVLAGWFMIFIIVSMILDFVYHIPNEYMQPISALGVVPFLVGFWLLMRPMAGYAALLWPLLYAIHALLILAGAPIVFTRPWDVLNILIPIVGYGMLSGLAGHLYSRFALRELKRLTSTDLADGDQPREAGGQ